MNQENPSKRKSASKHNSDRLQRLAENGIYMKASALAQRTSKDLCSSFLAGDRTPSQYPCYPSEQVPNVLERIQSLNEGRLQRDITPWVVPSAENLFFSGEITLDYIGEEIQQVWSRCAPRGGTVPKPDYTAGLLQTAFTQEEIEKLQNYASFEKPFFFTPNLCFPFLICEAKTGLDGLDKADRQNIHSASIAVGAIIELYKAAFGTTYPDRVNELSGQVLAFSVSHNNKIVNLYGHYAVLSDDSTGMLKFYRYEIAMFSLTMFDGADRYRAYNFVYNVYEKFAPEHRKRIKDAVASLPALAERTGPPLGLSELAPEETDSQQNFQVAGSQDDGVFRTPSEPASVAKMRQMERQIQQMESQRQQQIRQMEEQNTKLLQQMELQKQQVELQKQEMELQKQQMEVQKQQMMEQQQIRQLEQEKKKMEDKDTKLLLKLELEKQQMLVEILKKSGNYVTAAEQTNGIGEEGEGG